MIYRISHPDGIIKTEVHLPASKSLSNRALIISGLCKSPFSITNLSEAEDTLLLMRLLLAENDLLDAGDAGTTFRFMTAFASLAGKEIILTGSERMKQRPVGDLVNALNALGADISFMDKDGFPPLKIGKAIPEGGKVKINSSVSSQFISALLMVAPVFEKGLELEMTGEMISKPYIDMTLSMMKYFGITFEYNEPYIRISRQEYKPKPYTVEPDWSAASYWYEIAALSPECRILLKSLPATSLQGDQVINDIMKSFGVNGSVTGNDILLEKSGTAIPPFFEFGFSGCPDLAQTVACCCAGLNISADLKGLQSLRIKETNRAEALQRELYNLSVRTDFCDHSKLKVYNTRKLQSTGRVLKTHNDHRMAMSLAPLSLKLPYIDIDDPGVVVKSYPNYWDDLRSAGFMIVAR